MAVLPQTLSPTVVILHDLTDNCVSDRDACVDKLSASLAKDIKTLSKDVETVTQQINVSVRLWWLYFSSVVHITIVRDLMFVT